MCSKNSMNIEKYKISIISLCDCKRAHSLIKLNELTERLRRHLLTLRWLLVGKNYLRIVKKHCLLSNKKKLYFELLTFF